MRDLGKICFQIPARAGSKRVKAKNLRLINGEPMLYYAVAAAKEAAIGTVYVNSDSNEILALATALGVSYYKRPPELANDSATGDDFTYDFIRNCAMDTDTLVMVSPACPLVQSQDILGALNAFSGSSCDTLISSESTQMQVFLEEQPVNIDAKEALRPTQENRSVQILNWAVTVWDTKIFLKNFEISGYAYLGKNRLFYDIPKSRAHKVSTEADFRLASALLKSRCGETSFSKTVKPEYWKPETR